MWFAATVVVPLPKDVPVRHVQYLSYVGTITLQVEAHDLDFLEIHVLFLPLFCTKFGFKLVADNHRNACGNLLCFLVHDEWIKCRGLDSLLVWHRGRSFWCTVTIASGSLGLLGVLVRI